MARESNSVDRDTHILCVDASPASRDAVRDALAARVTGVESVAAAREFLDDANDADDPDDVACLVCEYDLPDAPENDGGALDFLDALASAHPALPVVVYTDAGDERIAGRAIAAGAAGYVPKRDGPAVLADRIDRILADTQRTATASTAADDTASTTGAEPSRPADPATIVEQAPLALVEVDANGDVVRWNDGATSLFGYEESEVLGEDLVAFLVPEEHRRSVNQVAEQVLSGTNITSNVNPNLRKDGSIVTCEWHSTTVRDPDGSVRSAVSLVHDVTEREQRKETIQQLRSVTRELVRANSASAIADRVIDAAEEILGQPYSAVYLADDHGELQPIASGDGFEEPPAPNPEDSATWRAYHAGEARVLEDDVTSMTTLDGTSPIESVLVLPLGEHGTLSLGSKDSDGFDDTDLQLSNILASATTAALDRTRREHDLQMHETITDAVGAGVFALDDDGYIETVNETLCELSGYDRDELIGSHASKIVDQETYMEASAEIGALDDDPGLARDVVTFEVDVETATGDYIPAEVNVAFLPETGDAGGVAGVVRDIRERKRMESELGEKRRKIENLHDIASLLDDCESRTDVWRLTVEAAEGVLDFDVCGIDEVRGEYLHSVGLSSEIEPEGYKTKAHVSDGIAGRTYKTGESFRIEDVRGDNEATPEKRTYRSLISVPVGDHGVFQAVSDEVAAFDEDDLELAELLMRHVADAIERIEFADRLREERDKFAALFENVPDPVVQTTLTGEEARVERVNPAFVDVFGYEPDDIVGENLNDYIVPPDRREEARALDERGVSGITGDHEVKRQTTDGLRNFDLTIVPVEPETDETSAYAVYTDITSRKERQKRVEILNRVLRHDLRNGMNIIKGSAEMLQDAVADTTAVGYADQVIERADDLLSLAEKTRAVERTLDRDSEATGPVSVRESVETSATRVREEYPDATVETTIEDDVEVLADDMLHTAIYHVVENAVEHNDSDEPTVEVRARIAPDLDDMLRIEVHDDGPGIPDLERELIEEEQEITQLRHASGLGLWLVDWVVNQSGGDLSFEPNDPTGSIVTLSVPIATESDVLPADDD